MTMFNDPSSSDFMPLDDLEGSLLLFTVYEETEEIVTVHGPNTAIRADVVVLDGSLEGETYDNTLIFPKILKSRLRGSVGGEMVVGRLIKGAKKPGLNAPWELETVSSKEKAIAQKFVESHGNPAEARAQREAAYEEPF